MVFSAPDITAVSNPNKKPPSAAIKAALIAKPCPFVAFFAADGSTANVSIYIY
jgi:hypothetical protein